MKNPGLLAACTVAWMFVGCTTSMRPVAYRASGTAPKFVEFRSGGYAGRTRFVTDGTHASYEHYKWKQGSSDGSGYVLDYQVQCLVTADEWDQFWRAVDKLNPSRWRSSYSQFDVSPSTHGEQVIVTDTENWSLTISTPQGSRKIKGDGAYPAAGHPEHVAGPTLKKAANRDVLRKLEAAFKELVGLPQNFLTLADPCRRMSRQS